MKDAHNHLIKNKNNFDLLRLIAAAGVLFTHSYELRKIDKEEPLVRLTSGQYSFSNIGLAIFFVISGFLVSRSLVGSSSVKVFLYKRFLRIWPALLVNIVLVWLVVGIFFTLLPVAIYLSDPLTIRFLLINISMVKTSLLLPGAFDGQPVNISLWTIPLEVRLYVLLALVYVFQFFKRRNFFVILWILAFLFLLSTMYSFSFIDKIPKQLTWGPGLAMYFLTGCLCFLYLEKIRFSFGIWIVSLALWSASVYFLPGVGHLLDYPFFSFTILCVALGIRPFRFIKTDLSYGIYLYAYPVQLMVQTVGGRRLNLIAYLFVVIIITVLLAIASWHLIEKRALRRKPV
jgi:peptidoglycan/LPS O-acetylase OafA/YrhL